MSTTALGLYPYLTRLLKPCIKWYFNKRAKKEPEYALHWEERFDAVYVQLSQELLEHFKSCGTIHIHCASLGEVEMVKPLLVKLLDQARNSQLKDSIKDCKFILTVFTPTGRAAGIKIAQAYNDLLTVVYAPLDYPETCKKFIQTFNPQVSIFTETELWPVFITSLKAAGIKLFLINARLNPQSIKRYFPNYRAVTEALKCFDVIGCQSLEQLENFLTVQIGATLDAKLASKLQKDFEDWKTNSKHLNTTTYPTFTLDKQQFAICGNLKFNKNVNTAQIPHHHLIQTQTQKRSCLLLSSTYVNESTIVLESLQKLDCLKSELPDVILAPRKLEDFTITFNKFSQLGYQTIKFSDCVDKFYTQYQEYHQLLQSIVAAILAQDVDQVDQAYRNAQQCFNKLIDTVNLNSEQPTLLIVDTFGHLNDLYYLGTANLVGGTFNQIGGHDPIFPLVFLMPVACGGNYSKQSNVVENLKQSEAIWSCGQRFKKWLKPTEQELKEQASQVFEFIKLHLEERIRYCDAVQHKFNLRQPYPSQTLSSAELTVELKELSNSLILQNKSYRAFDYFCTNQNALSNYLDLLNLSNE